MKKKVNIKKMIKLLSWTSVIGLFVMIFLSIYNTIVYMKNLEQVKTIVELVNKNTSDELKSEIVKSISAHISSTQFVVIGISVVGIILLSLVVYLGISIRKETDHRIHAMDWIIED